MWLFVSAAGLLFVDLLTVLSLRRAHSMSYIKVWLFVSATGLFVYLLALWPCGGFIPCRSCAESSRENAPWNSLLASFIWTSEEALFLSRWRHWCQNTLVATNTPVPMVFLSHARLEAGTTADLRAIPRLIPCRRNLQPCPSLNMPNRNKRAHVVHPI